MSEDWKTHCRVKRALARRNWFVTYEPPGLTPRLRLTHRGTWHADDMDIYFPTKGAAEYALEIAQSPEVSDPHQRLAYLESICRQAASLLRVHLNSRMSSYDVNRLKDLADSLENAAKGDK